MFKIDLKKNEFNGPLDLLLGLIQEQEMDISDLSISSVTEQYLDHLETLEDRDPEELADFLVIATRLLFLKSRKLLPQLIPEEEEGPGLAEQLRLYEKFVKTSEELNKLWDNPKRAYFRIEPPVIPESPEIPKNFTIENLHASMVKLLSRLKPPKPLPSTVIDKGISLREKVSHIRNLFKKQRSFSFNSLMESSPNRTELIVNFLAVLELVKQKDVYLKQDGSFGDIMINKI